MYVVLALVCVAVYVNGVLGEYVHDDLSAVLDNPDVQGTTSLSQVFLNDFWGRPVADPKSHKSYRPLTILSFRLTHQLWGNSAMADHVVNLGLHVGVTLLYAHTTATALGLSTTHALVSALAFATHPVHTEAVTGIVGRADLLAALAFLTSFLAYHRSMACGGVWWWGCGVWACVVGVLCKETALTALGVCVVWDVWHWASKRTPEGGQDSPSQGPPTRRVGWSIALVLVVVAARVLLNRGAPAFSDQDNPAAFDSSPMTRFLTKAFLPALNAWLLLCPSALAYDWQTSAVPLVTSLADPRNLASLGLYLTLLGLVVVVMRPGKGVDRGALVWGVAVVCLAFLPASNLCFNVGFVVAERLLYIPSLGWCTVVGVGAVRVCERLDVRVARRVLAVVVLAWCLKTARRNTDWWTRETLFSSGVAVLPHSAKMHYNLANVYKDYNANHRAIHHYHEAIRLWCRYPSAHNNLGTVLVLEGRPHDAETHFTLALHTHPHHHHAATNLATLWRQQGRIPRAISLLESVFRPEDVDQEGVGPLLAELYLTRGESSRAEGVFLSLTAAHPAHPDILADYADFLHKIGRHEAATRTYEAALSLAPTHAPALTRYAHLMASSSHHAHATALYARALDEAWDPHTATSLAKLYLSTGQLTRAHHVLTRVLTSAPHHNPAKVYMAQVKFQGRDYDTSETILGEVLEEEPQHREALYHLSLVYQATNRSHQAVGAARGAARGCSEPGDLCAALHAHHADVMHNMALVDAAVMSYQEAVRLDPSLIRAHINLGAIRHTQGRYLEALGHYRRALDNDPVHPVALENMTKLRRAMDTR